MVLAISIPIMIQNGITNFVSLLDNIMVGQLLGAGKMEEARDTDNKLIAFIGSHYTALYVVWIYVLVQVGDWTKCILGAILLKKGVWLQNIVAEEE